MGCKSRFSLRSIGLCKLKKVKVTVMKMILDVKYIKLWKFKSSAC